MVAITGLGQTMSDENEVDVTGAVGAVPPAPPSAGGSLPAAADPVSIQPQAQQDGGAGSVGAMPEEPAWAKQGQGTGKKRMIDNITTVMSDKELAKSAQAAQKGYATMTAEERAQLATAFPVKGENAKAQGEEIINDAEKGGFIGKDIAKKLLKNWRNVYKTIPEEQMGLFLIDFGLRAMMAGETMGNLGALGAAGSGALQAMQGRQATDKAAALEAERYEREFALKEKDSESRRITAEAAATKAKQTGQRAYRDEIAVKSLVASGYTEEQAGLIIYGRGVSEEEAKRIAEEGWARALKDETYDGLIDPFDWADMSPAEKQRRERAYKKKVIDAIAVKKGSGALATTERPGDKYIED